MSSVNLKLFGVVKKVDEKRYCPLTIGKGSTARVVEIVLPSTWDYSADKPISVAADFRPHCYLFKNRLVDVIQNNGVDENELLLRIKHFVLKQDKELVRIQKEVQAFENLSQMTNARREQISESVRLFVWQRDQGKCVKCSSNEKLEFDHVIPVSKGGANTERNIQLLCENCNRSKGASIG